MNSKSKKTIGLLFGCVICSSANAIDYSIYAQGGLLGIGGGVGVDLSKGLQLRLGYGALNYDIDEIEDTDVTYDAELNLSAATALVDWHPFDGSFRLTAGVAWNNSDADVTGKPAADGTYEFNGITYTAADVGRVKGKLDFSAAAPYFGIGWGYAVSKNGHFGFMLDLGVIYQGAPDISLSASCSTASSQCAQLQDDVAVEEKELEDSISDLEFFPVINLSVSYRF